jgi:ubiquinone/menaquinone biosynthesis C-methylase UbiE
MTPYRFDNVDATDPKQCIAFLDAASSMKAVQRIKQRSFDMLSLRQGAVVLDVGCGTGTDACAMAALVGESGRVFGVDSSRAMVSEAQSRADRLGLPLTFLCGDIYALPFDDSFVEGCRADRVLHFLQAPDAALREMSRVTAPGARIVISEPDWDSLEVNGANDELTHAILAANKGGKAASQSIGSRLSELFMDANLVVEQCEPIRLEERNPQICLALFNLPRAAQRAAAVGHISANDANVWLQSIMEAGQQGRLICTLSGQIVSGVKPLAGLRAMKRE